ncbi:MAG: hypothetical protein JKY54_00155 [Flavobacteriales bacterium]|nr:hypothetical protein [Flavobacteriales bacterium]
MTTRKLYPILQLLCLLILSCNGYSQKTIHYTDKQDVYHLHDCMEMLVDTDCSISDEAVLNAEGFNAYSKGMLCPDCKGYWIRFSIYNETDNKKRIYLNTAYFDSVKTYEFDSTGQRLVLLSKSGVLIPVEEEMPKVHRTNLCLLYLPSKVKITYYVRLYAKSTNAREIASISLSEGFDLMTFEKVQQSFFNLRDHAFLFAGALFIMFLFNLLLAFKGKEAVYYWLAGYNLIFCLTTVNSFGYTMSSGISESFGLMQTLHFYLPEVLILTYLGFSVSLLELKNRFTTAYKVMIGVAILLLLAIFIQAVGYPIFAIAIIVPVVIFGFFALFIFAIKAYLKGFKPAMFFIAGSTLISILFFNYVIGIFVESRDYYMGEFLVTVSAFGELIIFTYATVQKFNASQKEAFSLNVKRQVLIEQQEEMRLEIEQKSKELIAKTTIEISKFQKQSELLELLGEIKKSSGAESDMSLHRATAIVKQLTGDTSFKDGFLLHFNGVHKGFEDNLCRKHPSLSASEIKLCAYLRMNLTSLDIAQLQGVEKSSVNQARYRLRKKMNLDKEVDLVVYMSSI